MSKTKSLIYGGRDAKKRVHSLQKRVRGGVVGEEGAETGKCATILCRTLMCSNCARQAHYEPSLTSEQWGHSASSSPARKGQNKSRRLKAVSDFELERSNHPRTGLLSRDLHISEERQ